MQTANAPMNVWRGRRRSEEQKKGRGSWMIWGLDKLGNRTSNLVATRK